MSNEARGHEALLENNKAWVERKLGLDSEYFARTAKGQTPKFLWIGCSDSRVPAEDITGVEPGELFVHRNIANLVIHTDFSMLSVVQFGVEVLEVEDIIVCGHYGCGGVEAAISRRSLGLIDNWLRNVKDVYRLHAEELDALADPGVRTERLVELNVVEQVHQLCKLSFLQSVWRQERRPRIHGWIYDIRTGYLRQIAKIDPLDLPHDIYLYGSEEP